MLNKDISKVFEEIADLIELTGGNAFRAKAFANAARVINKMEVQATYLMAENTLSQVQGIGAGLVRDIQTLVETGGLPLRDELLAALPNGLPEVLKIKGLGVKKVRHLWQSLGVDSIESLEEMALQNKLVDVEGFGKKTQENILTGIAQLRVYRTQRRYATAFKMAKPMLETLSQQFNQAVFVGEMRRKMPTVSAVEYLIEAENDLQMRILSETHTLERNAHDVFESTFPDGLTFRIYTATAPEFGTKYWKLTGSDEHIEAFTQQFGTPISTSDEAAIYAHAQLDFVAPEMRNNGAELALAKARNLPKLITVADLKGSLHNHSTYSDGANTLKQMADACFQMGLQYLGICDHSQSLKIANGMPPKKVAFQQAEIQELNAEFTHLNQNFRIFSGIESDILADGSLDYADDVLKTFDFIVASVHQGMNMSEEAATNRLIKAIENPFTRILGHPTGRLLLAREGYPIHHERIIAACAKHGVAIELNANPYRLDLDWTWIHHATKQGVLISINPDAHSTEGLKDVFWGVEVARKAGLTAAQCLNAMDLEAFSKWIMKG